MFFGLGIYSPDLGPERGCVPAGGPGDAAEQTLTDPGDEACVALETAQKVRTHGPHHLRSQSA